MDDLISRQAAIDAALTFLVEYCGAAFDEDMQKMLCDRIKDLPSAEPESILVTERLPNDEDYHNFAQFPDGAVLWCTDKGIVGAGWYYESTKSWSCLDDTFPERYGNVIAWMPLPKPYQEEKHGQH